MLDFDDVRGKVNNGEYDNKKPWKNGKIREKNVLTEKNPMYDEKLAVNEIKAKTKKYNEEINNIQEEYSKENRRLEMQFEKDVMEAIINDDSRINSKQAEIIFNKAYSDGHSSGYYEVINYAEELMAFINNYENNRNEK